MERKEVRERIRKTIEEFVKNREKYGEEYNIYFPGVQNDLAIRITNAINAVIPDGAVVLTKEEYDKLHIFDDEMFERILDNERESGREETAREILGDLKDMLDGAINTTVRFTLSAAIIHIENKYGVEVEE